MFLGVVGDGCRVRGEMAFWQHLLDQNESLLNLTLIPFACAQFTKVFCIN